MSELNRVDTTLLEVIAGMKDGKAEGAFNIRKDSGCAGRVNTENVTITTKTDKPGIDIRFVPGCKDSCHIPVIITGNKRLDRLFRGLFLGCGRFHRVELRIDHILCQHRNGIHILEGFFFFRSRLDWFRRGCFCFRLNG